MLATTKASNRTFPSSQLLADAAPLVSYSVNVTNTGKMDADDVVLGFLVPPGAGVNGVPLQSLYAFNRVHVPAGKTVTVELCVEPRSVSPHRQFISPHVCLEFCFCCLIAFKEACMATRMQCV